MLFDNKDKDKGTEYLGAEAVGIGALTGNEKPVAEVEGIGALVWKEKPVVEFVLAGAGFLAGNG